MLYGEPYVISHYLQPDFYEKLQRFHIFSIFVFIFDMQLKIHNQNYSAERIDRNNRCLSVFHYQKSRLKYSRGTSWPLKFVVINQKIKNPCLWFQFHIYQDLSVAAIICKCEMSEWSRKECFFKSALEKSPCKNSWSSLF